MATNCWLVTQHTSPPATLPAGEGTAPCGSLERCWKSFSSSLFRGAQSPGRRTTREGLCASIQQQISSPCISFVVLFHPVIIGSVRVHPCDMVVLYQDPFDAPTVEQSVVHGLAYQRHLAFLESNVIIPWQVQAVTRFWTTQTDG